jgi:hypothetical protein
MRFHHPIIDGFMPYKPPPWEAPPWNTLHYHHFRILLTIAILLSITNTTTNKTISTLDVYPRRIFLSNKHYNNIQPATTTLPLKTITLTPLTTTLPSTSITLTPLTTTSTRGNTFSYHPNFANTKLTTTAIDSRVDIIHPSTSPILPLPSSTSTRGNTFHYNYISDVQDKHYYTFFETFSYQQSRRCHPLFKPPHFHS